MKNILIDVPIKKKLLVDLRTTFFKIPLTKTSGEPYITV